MDDASSSFWHDVSGMKAYHHHYLRLSTTPSTDALAIRQTIQKSLADSFGSTMAGTYVDILWVGEDGQSVIRVNPADKPAILQAIASSSFSLVKESRFLAALL
ncbi:hypothetical protein VKT23_014303 [Stygiomarasmius scandens]|uniref:Ribonucleases P/MRP subunit Pop8-like domain-containing protein n=1 Tax=Marasmiellus scandens TaxID=2682957 RepID=A0ABR1J0Z5_9AGAR